MIGKISNKLVFGTIFLILGANLPVISTVSTQEIAVEANANDLLLKRGKRMFLRCRTCHTLQEGAKHGTGPNLYGIFGSKSASKEGFTYSPALLKSEIIWSEETIENWMSKPRDFVRGTSMAFVGLKKPEDRKALIAYLKLNTQ